MIDIAPEKLAIVRRLRAAQVPDCEVRAFGSRVTGKASQAFRGVITAQYELLQNSTLTDAESAKLEQATKANLAGLGYAL